MRVTSTILVIYSAFLLTSCANLQHEETVDTTNQAISLPKTPWRQDPLLAKHNVTIQFQDRVIQLQSILNLQPGSLKMVMVDFTGTRAVEIDWTEQSLKASKAPQIPDTITAEQILNRIVFAFWPEDIVQQNIRDPYIFSASSEKRSIKTKDSLISTAKYLNQDKWNGQTIIEQYNPYLKISVSSSTHGKD